MTDQPSSLENPEIITLEEATTAVIAGTVRMDELGSFFDRAFGEVARVVEGQGAAVRPKEALLAALAGCTSMDVASILRKKRQSAAGYEIAVSGESADEHPRVFTAVTVELRA